MVFPMRRVALSLLSLLALGAALGLALNALTNLVQEDRAALTQQFTRAREMELERAATSVVARLDEVSDDVRFAGELLGQRPPLTERRAELEALLASIGKYKAIVVFDAQAQQVLALRDRHFAEPLEPHLPTLRGTAEVALRQPVNQVAVSTSLESDRTGWLRVFATAIDDASGATIGVVAVLVDVAPLMTSLRALNEDQGTRLLVLGAHGRPLPVADQLLAGAVKKLDASPAFARLVGSMRSGKASREVVPAKDAAALGLPEVELIGIGLPLPVHGGASWSVASFSSAEQVRSRDRALVGRLVLVAGVLAGFFALLGVSLTVASQRARELNESRRHAEELARARDLIQNILDHVPTGVLALSKDLEVTAANRVLREKRPVRRGARLEELLADGPPTQAEQVLALVRRSREEKQVASLHAESLFGGEGHFRLVSVPLEPGDPQLASLLVVDDLSLVRTLEEQLVRAEKLSTVGVLAAGIAHEIGTPLGIVRGRAEYLGGKLPEDSPHRAGLTSIVEQIDGVSRIIRQLLDFSRLQPAATTAVRLAGVFEGLRQLLGVEAERRGLTLEVEPPGELAVAADADQLQQVLVNLLINAFDASKQGQVVRLFAERGEGAVALVVSDEGAGMTEDEQRRMFDPFWTTKKRGQGTGLGLAVVAQLVRNHGGSLHVSSQPQKGTTVRVSWPPPVERARPA